MRSVLIGVLRATTTSGHRAYATADARQDGADYTAPPESWNSRGEKLKLVHHSHPERWVEGASETFGVSQCRGVWAVRTATITIVDNDPGVQFEFNKYLGSGE